jgi:hypothetical protein
VLSADPEIIGDRQWLDLVMAAQQENVQAHEEGWADVFVEERRGKIDQLKLHKRFVGRAYWSRGRLAINGTVENSPVSEAEVVSTAIRFLETSEMRMTYVAHLAICRVWAGKRPVLDDALSVAPRQAWFSFGLARPWIDILDPQSEVFREVERRYRISHDGASTVTVEREFLNSRQSLIIKLALDRGGNVVEYATGGPMPEDEGFWDEGSYDWKSDGRGGWRLASYEYVRQSINGGRPTAEVRAKVRVDQWSPQIPSDVRPFHVDWLEIPRGTLVEERDGRSRVIRTYLFGQASGSTNDAEQKQLDELADRLRGRGFAGKDR